MNDQHAISCPCGSGLHFADCCEPLITAKEKAKTPEALMRSRYTAYVFHNIPYLARTLHPSQRGDFDEQGASRWSREAQWEGLEILSTSAESPGEDTGRIEFKAHFRRNGIAQLHHEVSEFRKSDGIWYFYDGKNVGNRQIWRESPKIGRNDPCPCGSGYKYKRCCGQR
jgi:SEC-C motif-containing protein